MNFLRIDNLIGNIVKYTQVKSEITKIEARERAVRGLFLLARLSVMVVLFSIFVLFMNFAMAFYINEFYPKHQYKGYLIVALLQIFLMIAFQLGIWFFPKLFAAIIRLFLIKFEDKVFRDED